MLEDSLVIWKPRLVYPQDHGGTNMKFVALGPLSITA
jgi:hypothetical protein